MKKENILTYKDVETILKALRDRAMDERERAETVKYAGDNVTAEYHLEQVAECNRLISKLCNFQIDFQF